MDRQALLQEAGVAYGRYTALLDQLKEQEDNETAGIVQVNLWTTVEELLKAFAESRRATVKSRIEAAVTSGLRQVFGREYSFIVGDATKTGAAKNAAFMVRHGEHLGRLEDAFGEGVMAIVSFMLWLAVATMVKGVKQIVVFDEPFTKLRPEMIPAARTILERLVDVGWQVIVVTNQDDLALPDETADGATIHTVGV